MKTHTIIGGKTLGQALAQYPEAQFLEVARNIAFWHHERFDGSGYPHGLAGEDIPLCARIVALADVYDALTSKRPYKKAYPHETAREIILEKRNRHFDPDIVDAFAESDGAVLRRFRRASPPSNRRMLPFRRAAAVEDSETARIESGFNPPA